MSKQKKILIIEPYYGGSHKSFIRGMINYVNLDFTLITLPARKWKMRMQTAAFWAFQEIIRWREQGVEFSLLFCSAFMDVAALKTLLLRAGINIPVLVYFHENQFAYPGQSCAPDLHQFTYMNWTTAVAADKLFFNSDYNYQSFMTGLSMLVGKAADVDISWTLAEISAKSEVLYPGIDFSFLRQSSSKNKQNEVPVIIWNHRWEHDKNPEEFFRKLFTLADAGYDFKLVVLGENFRFQPDIFNEAKERLSSFILHWGYVENKLEYGGWLMRGDMVVSTARHEFFGMAVLEAVYAGCRPLLPDALAYREIYPPSCRYEPGLFLPALRSYLREFRQKEDRAGWQEFARQFSWDEVKQKYQDKLIRLIT